MAPGVSMAVTIDRRQRDALRDELLADLTGIGDVYVLVEAHDFDEARAYRRRFEDTMRLLDDLGWAPETERERFVLRMPTEELAAVLRRLSERAADAARMHRAVELEEHRAAERALELWGICEEVVTRVTQLGGSEPR